MEPYGLPQKIFDYFIGIRNTPTQKTIIRYARELKQGKELETILRNLGIRQTLRFASNIIANVIEVGNLYWMYKTRMPETFSYSTIMTESARFAINYLFNFRDRRDLKRIREELYQMRHESWQRIVENGARKLGEK